MKMKMIKNNIAFCNIIIFFVGLVTFKQNIILLQKKEFSKIILTKLIPKGLTSPSWTGLYCFLYYVGLLSYIIDNIAINTSKFIATVADNLLSPSVILLSANAEDSFPFSPAGTGRGVLLAFSSLANGQEDKVLSNGRDQNEQEKFITINKNESEIEVLKLFREKEMFPPMEPSTPPFFPSGDRGKDSQPLSFFPKGENGQQEGFKQELVELKPLLFNYLITKNNQNGIGLDLKNKKLLLGSSFPFSPAGTGEGASPLLLPLVINPLGGGGDVKLGNSNYNFNSSFANQSIFNFSHPLGKKETQIVENKNWYLSEDLIKLISAFFKSIYCLISKPKFINTPDKIIIEILYFITIPDYKIFKWYNFIYNSSNNSNLTVKSDSKIIAPSPSPLGGEGKLPFFPLRDAREGKFMKRRNKSIKLILRKNNLIKKTLFKLNNTNITKLYFNKFIILFKLLSSYFKKPIEFNLIRLHKSNYDSNILAQLFYLILKKKNIRSAIHNLYTKNKFSTIPFSPAGTGGGSKPNSLSLVTDDKLATSANSNYIPAYISGLYIHIGGRLMREPIIPRKTTKKFEKGAIATGKVNFVDTARITKKNKKGAYTIKIAFAQNFMFK